MTWSPVASEARVVVIFLSALVALTGCASADAKCLGSAEAGPVYRYYFVDFTVGGDAVGSLTRLRCFKDGCTVAGTDN